MMERSSGLVTGILEQASKVAPFNKEAPTLVDLQNQNLFILQVLLDVINVRLEFLEAKVDLKTTDITALLLRQLNREAPDFKLETEHPIAAGSADHTEPAGAIQDNTRKPRFVGACEKYFGSRKLNYLDLGCSGGGLVLDFLLAGHLALGIDGSDRSLRAHRAEWRTIPSYLKTCDITQPFTLRQGASPMIFDVITAWEVLEHPHPHQIPPLLDNVKRHLAKDGLFVGSIALFPDGNRHNTLKPREWWAATFRESGLAFLDPGPFELEDFARGSGKWGDADFSKNPELGFHVVATHL